MIKYKLIQFLRARGRQLVLLLALVFLSSCGEGWDVDPGLSDHFSARFHYYYIQTCAYDYEPYNCSSTSSLSPSMTVGLKEEHDGFVTLTIDGDVFYFEPLEYIYDYDYSYGDYYYQFSMDGEEITVYVDGGEMIYLDRWAGEAIYYYSSLY